MLSRGAYRSSSVPGACILAGSAIALFLYNCLVFLIRHRKPPDPPDPSATSILPLPYIVFGTQTCPLPLPYSDLQFPAFSAAFDVPSFEFVSHVQGGIQEEYGDTTTNDLSTGENINPLCWTGRISDGNHPQSIQPLPPAIALAQSH